MTRNIQIILWSSILFGLAVGIYDFAFPYYLDAHHISFANMGYIFAISSLIMFAVRIYLGNLSDRAGRKVFYSLSLAASAVANFLTPLTARVALLTGLKGAREAAFMTREVMHPVVLYEEKPDRFLDFIGKTRGLEYAFQGIGTMTAGLLLAMGFGFVFGFSGALLAIAFLAFTLIFREGSHRPRPKAATGWRDLFTFDLSPNLKIIAVSSFIFTIGLTCSHSFIMPLFFSKKFGVPDYTVAVVLMLHRFTLALPMIFAGHIPPKYFKSTYIGLLVVEGIAITISSVVPGFLLAASIWLIHDLIGASLWVPIQGTIIQQYSRPELRGSDVSKTLALSSLGGIAGPFLAGYLSSLSISGPFFVSGLIMALSAIPLVKLRLNK